MIAPAWPVVVSVVLVGAVLSAIAPPAERLRVTIVRNRSEGPAVMEREGLKERLNGLGCDIARVFTVQLTPEEDRQDRGMEQDGAREQEPGPAGGRDTGKRPDARPAHELLGPARHARGPATSRHGEECRRATGGHGPGRRQAAPRRSRVVDAHADFNTPETTLSGMLGGMPVADRIRHVPDAPSPASPASIPPCPRSTSSWPGCATWIRSSRSCWTARTARC